MSSSRHTPNLAATSLVNSSSTPSLHASVAPQISSSSTTSSVRSSQNRLQQIKGHMAPGDNKMTTAFSEAVVPQAPEDPLFGLMAAYRKDTFEKKVDLGIGAYRDDNAKPWVLPVVRKAEDIIRNDPDVNHEYLPIAGLQQFTTASQKLILGADSPAIQEGRVASLQTISGTGAVHLGAAFLSKFYKPSSSTPTVYVSNPTWANHNQIFSTARLPTKPYRYFSSKTKGLDFEGMLADLSAAPPGSIVLLHACAHNPTGVDPTQEQWKQIAELLASRSLFPFFDCAYQGFASGNLAQDAWAIRYFISLGFELLVAQSYAKNFGLYGERAGCFHFVTSPASDAQTTTARIASQLAIIQRSEISNPPAYGARIASLILNDASLFAEWEENLQTMSGRIIQMRSELRQGLEDLDTPGTWNHVTDQIGMFSFTGLTEEQVLKIRRDAHVYMTKNGRISMAGLNSNNVRYVAEAIDKVVRETTTATTNGSH